MSIGVSDIPQEVSDQWREVFNQIADGAEDIGIKDFGRAVRAGGQCPTTEQLQVLVEDVSGIEGEPDPNMRVTWQQYERAMASSLNDWKSEDDLREALRVFDKDQAGYIPLPELRYFLTTAGDMLEPEEMHELITEAQASGCFDSAGVNISIDEFIKKVMPPIPGQ
eukprot:TRINITY_DN68045_c0_g1_i1.p1 TRINITY_DN68045_c0_g1~~TRINITY_DN68045_c0_g1_i1.p1  ORF type:complete len:166 (+),score=60.48 TRINITY_DN68045_c0_g1_i1:21-518(+)